MRRAPHVLSLLLAALAAAPFAALHPVQPHLRISIGPNVSVPGDSTRPHVEPHFAINPRDRRNIVAASIVADTSWYTIAVHGTRDGGRTWWWSAISECDFDPWVAFLPSGEALLSCLGRRSGPTPVLVFRSANGGQTWRGPAEIPLAGGSFDHPAMVISPGSADGLARPMVLAMQTVRAPTGQVLAGPAISESPDAGATFASPQRLLTSNAWSNVGNPIALQDGSVGFVFFDYAVDGRTRGGGLRELRTPRVWWSRWIDSARTFSLSSLVTELHEMSRSGWVIQDTARGPYAGSLYYVVDDFRDGTGGVFLYRSRDGGETWSGPTRLSRDDAPRVRRIPAAAVNGRGQLVVAWFDPRGTPERRCWRLVVAASVDGGDSFTPSAPVTEEVCNAVRGNVVPRSAGPFNVASRWPAGGDYFGLAALDDRAFRAVWSDSRTGVFQVWTARIEIN